jgi:hypothetical protein
LPAYSSRTVNDFVPVNKYMYVLNSRGKLIAAIDAKELHLNWQKEARHSSLSFGHSTFSAGHFVTNDKGIITHINGQSGHYLTPDRNLVSASLYLYKENYLDVNVKLQMNDRYAVARYIKSTDTIDWLNEVTIGEILKSDLFDGDRLIYGDTSISTRIYDFKRANESTVKKLIFRKE